MSIKSPYHQWELNRRFDALWIDCQTIVTWDELYVWYGVQKVAAGTYRDLLEQWEAYVGARGEDAKDHPLTVYFKRQQGIFAAIIRRDFDDRSQTEKLSVLARR